MTRFLKDLEIGISFNRNSKWNTILGFITFKFRLQAINQFHATQILGRKHPINFDEAGNACIPLYSQIWVKQHFLHNTVDGRNPAPPGMYKTL